MALRLEYSPRKDSSLLTPLYSLTKSELVENKSELIEIVSKVRGVRSEERGVRAEWEAPRRGNESIAQWQANKGERRLGEE